MLNFSMLRTGFRVVFLCRVLLLLGASGGFGWFCFRGFGCLFLFSCRDIGAYFTECQSESLSSARVRSLWMPFLCWSRFCRNTFCSYLYYTAVLSCMLFFFTLCGVSARSGCFMLRFFTFANGLFVACSVGFNSETQSRSSASSESTSEGIIAPNAISTECNVRVNKKISKRLDWIILHTDLLMSPENGPRLS